MKALKSTGVTELAATGYCFGGTFWYHFLLMIIGGFILLGVGRYTFDFAFENIIKVAVVAHPFLIKVPEDFEVRGVYFSSIYLRCFPYDIFSSLFHISWLCPSHSLITTI